MTLIKLLFLHVCICVKVLQALIYCLFTVPFLEICFVGKRNAKSQVNVDKLEKPLDRKNYYASKTAFPIQNLHFGK